MEEKKSKKADLEHGWGRRFLFGLVVSLFCFLTALIIPFPEDDPLDDPDLLEMFSMDEELSSLMRPENELALAPKVEPEPSKKLVVKDEEQMKELLKDDEPVETDMDNDMSATDEEEKEEQKKEDEPVEFRVVEDLPQFPGGAIEMMKFLQRNLKYPPTIQERKIQGKVIAEFIVNKDGSVTDVKVVQSLNPLCDREVLRVLRMMPRWTAGIQNDEPCRTKVCIPVVFKL